MQGYDLEKCQDVPPQAVAYKEALSLGPAAPTPILLVSLALDCFSNQPRLICVWATPTSHAVYVKASPLGNGFLKPATIPMWISVSECPVADNLKLVSYSSVSGYLWLLHEAVSLPLP